MAQSGPFAFASAFALGRFLFCLIDRLDDLAATYSPVP
jgi:hypothetical protein